jgi:hypothetical protein
VAVKEWLPGVVSDEVVVLALPATTGTGPMVAVPSENVTVPVAVEGVTLAVNSTPCPGLIEVGEAERLVVEVALLTCWLTGKELLALKVPSPE